MEKNVVPIVHSNSLILLNFFGDEFLMSAPRYPLLVSFRVPHTRPKAVRTLGGV